MRFSFLTGKKLQVFLHFSVWIILFLLPTYFFYIESSNDWNFLFHSYTQTILYAVIFYMNYLFLIPKFFFGKKKVLYFITATSLILLLTPLQFMVRIFPAFEDNRNPGIELPMPPLPDQHQNPGPFMEENRPRPLREGPTYYFLLTSFLVTGFSFGLRFYDKHNLNEKQRKEAEKEKLNSELAFLKNQINPHFFFNTLNNIYSLVQTRVEDGQKAILQLSKLMRYLLYETEKGDTLLSQEIDFMKNYIELMKLRLSKRVSLNIEFPENFQDVTIPPLLFLPFIENAFKHGISYKNPSFINILMKVGEHEICFECNNSLGTKGDELIKSEHGIGLENVRKRLSLLYPGNHQLSINESETSFHVVLTIRMTQNETI
jgi:two-component system, LytTR family, sensor kinase